jgi:hypothetical protein
LKRDRSKKGEREGKRGRAYEKEKEKKKKKTRMGRDIVGSVSSPTVPEDLAAKTKEQTSFTSARLPQQKVNSTNAVNS